MKVPLVPSLLSYLLLSLVIDRTIAQDDDTKYCNVHPDPHFRSWNGFYFDFQSGCDVVLVKTSEMEIQLRLVKDPVYSFSFIQRLAMRFLNANSGFEEIEIVQNGSHYLNGNLNVALSTISTYPISKISSPSTSNALAEYKVTFPNNHYITVSDVGTQVKGGGLHIQIKGHGSMFDTATGMCGDWYDYTGLNSRTGVDMASGMGWVSGTYPVIANAQAYGDEWQVLPATAGFISTSTLPFSGHAIHPDNCVASRRRLEVTRELEVASCSFCDTLTTVQQIANCKYDVAAFSTAGQGCNWVQNVIYYKADNIFYNANVIKTDQLFPCKAKGSDEDHTGYCPRIGKCVSGCNTKDSNYECITCLGCGPVEGEMFQQYLMYCSCQVPKKLPQSPCPGSLAYLQLEVQGDSKSQKENSYVLKKNGKKLRAKKDFIKKEFHTYGNCYKEDSCFELKVKDKGGNGLCCDKGNGYVKLSFNGEVKESRFYDGEKLELTIGKCVGKEINFI